MNFPQRAANARDSIATVADVRLKTKKNRTLQSARSFFCIYFFLCVCVCLLLYQCRCYHFDCIHTSFCIENANDIADVKVLIILLCIQHTWNRTRHREKRKRLQIGRMKDHQGCECGAMLKSKIKLSCGPWGDAIVKRAVVIAIVDCVQELKEWPTHTHIYTYIHKKET